MQPTYVKLKLQVKAILAILVFMVTCQQGTSNDLRKPKPCFGEIWMPRGFYVNTGIVSVNNKTHQLYIGDKQYPFLRISTLTNNNKTVAFYLFDKETRTFLCFKNFNGPVVAMNYKSIIHKNHWDHCKFVDVAEMGPQSSHIKLQLAGNRHISMKFNRKGQSVGKRKMQRCKNKKKCKIYEDFLEIGHVHDCKKTAVCALCVGPTKYMDELREQCKQMSWLTKECGRNKSG